MYYWYYRSSDDHSMRGGRAVSFFNFFIFRLEKFAWISWKFTSIVQVEFELEYGVSFLKGGNDVAEGSRSLFYLPSLFEFIRNILLSYLKNWFAVLSRLKSFKNESYLQNKINLVAICSCVFISFSFILVMLINIIRRSRHFYSRLAGEKSLSRTFSSRVKKKRKEEIGNVVEKEERIIFQNLSGRKPREKYK